MFLPDLSLLSFLPCTRCSVSESLATAFKDAPFKMPVLWGFGVRDARLPNGRTAPLVTRLMPLRKQWFFVTAWESLLLVPPGVSRARQGHFLCSGCLLCILMCAWCLLACRR